MAVEHRVTELDEQLQSMARAQLLSIGMLGKNCVAGRGVGRGTCLVVCYAAL